MSTIIGPDLVVVRLSDLEQIRSYLSGLEGLAFVHGIEAPPEIVEVGRRVFMIEDTDPPQPGTGERGEG